VMNGLGCIGSRPEDRRERIVTMLWALFTFTTCNKSFKGASNSSTSKVLLHWTGVSLIDLAFAPLMDGIPTKSKGHLIQNSKNN
jgi:hypothetical protein